MSTQKLTIIVLVFLLGLLAVGSGCTTAATTVTDASSPDADEESLAQEFGTAETRLAASDAESFLHFGHSVAISGDTLVVGATGLSTTIDQGDESEPVAGAAYVFQKDGTTWIEQSKLTASGVEAGDEFGYAVAIDGDTVVVGARFKNDAIGGNGAGAAYVFQRRGTTWTEQAKLTASDAAPFDLFGQAVAISGDTVVIGARSADDPAGGRNAGAVYVFQRQGKTWTQQAKLTASDARAIDHFGHAVAINGNTVVVGAFGHDDPAAGHNSGAVYIFQRRGETWTEQAKLTASDARPNAQFGYALAMSGDALVVGANQDSDEIASNAARWPEGALGAIYVFQRKGKTWTEQAKLTPSQPGEYGGFFGEAVAIGHTATGDVIAVGEMWSGTIYLFQEKEGTWVEIPKLMAPSDSVTITAFGEPVAISGEAVVVGAKRYSERTVSRDIEVRATEVVVVEKEVTKIVAGTPVVEKVVETKVIEKVVATAPHAEQVTMFSGAVYVYDLRSALARSPATSTEVKVTEVVVVEKEVTKIAAGTPVVEKVIETKVIEKVVTATPAPPESATPIPPAPTLSVQKTIIKPFLTIERISFQDTLFGGWSPGGGILAFSTVDKPDPQSDRLFETLRFLNVNTGEVCSYPETYQGTMDIRLQIAWLPDDRILIVTDHNDVVLHAPCTDDFTTVSDDFPEPILAVAAQSPDRSMLLLRGQHEYWLFEPATQNVRQVEGLDPSHMPADTTRRGDVNRYDWSPSGDQVAISTPGSATSEAGDTVYLVNVQTGQVEQTIDLESASERRAPHPEWLISDQLVIWVGGDSGPVQVTLGPGTPQIVPIIPEIFGLDIKYPDDMEAIAAIGDQVANTYHIVMALGLPGSNTVYLYHSESGTVEKLPHERTTFLFFPNDDWVRMPKRDRDNPAGALGSVDEFQLVWVDSDQEARHLVVEGHIPREYPDLNAVWFPDRSQMAFSSSQGVSMVSIPDGALLDFWELEGYGGSSFPHLFASPTGDVILAVAHFSDPDGQLTGEGLYLIDVSR